MFLHLLDDDELLVVRAGRAALLREVHLREAAHDRGRGHAAVLHDRGHAERRDERVVEAVVILEAEEVARLFAADERVALGHRVFHVAVADLAHHRFAAEAGDFGFEDARVADREHDRRALVAREHVFREHEDDRIGRVDVSFLVDEAEAVAVAVVGEAHVRFFLDDGFLQLLERRALARVGGVVRERAVRFDVELDHLRARFAQRFAVHRSCHAVAAVHDDLEALEALAEHLLHGRQVGRHAVVGLHRAVGARGEAAFVYALPQALDVVAEERVRVRQAQLEAVVLGGVMAGRHLHAGVEIAVANGEVAERARRGADREDVAAGFRESVDDGAFELRSVRAGVPAHADARGFAGHAFAEFAAVTAGDEPGGLDGELFERDAADVVRAENAGVDGCHAPMLSPMPSGVSPRRRRSRISR